MKPTSQHLMAATIFGVRGLVSLQPLSSSLHSVPFGVFSSLKSTCYWIWDQLDNPQWPKLKITFSRSHFLVLGGHICWGAAIPSTTVTQPVALGMSRFHSAWGQCLQRLQSVYHVPGSVQSDFHSLAHLFHLQFVPSQHMNVWPSFPQALSACRTMACELISGANWKGKWATTLPPPPSILL